MTNPAQYFPARLRGNLTTVAFALAVCVVAIATMRPAQAQTFTVLHRFGGVDGNLPTAPILDRAGNLYGTTVEGGPGEFGGFGNIYKLSHTASGWVFNTLYNFTAHADGAYPDNGGPTIGPDGTLYGTAGGEGAGGNGTLYNLRPPATFCRSIFCDAITVLHAFAGGNDGSGPNANLVFDAAGNIYGTTAGGGEHGYGTVFQATRSGGSWTETVLHSFNPPDGINPTAGVILDSAGNLYGTTVAGGAHNWGTVFELTHSGSGWTEQVLYTFTNTSDGRSPFGGLVMDSAGNLYGSAQHNGHNFGGTVFKLSRSGGGWTFTLLYSLSGLAGPADHLTLDSAGNLYGTTYQDGVNQQGSVFELSPSGGGWVYTDLHDFSGDDGALPTSTVVLDPSGNIFGTTSQGVNGVIFEITR